MSRSNDMADLDTWMIDEPQCPYCKAVQSTDDRSGDGDNTETCESCGKEFEMTTEFVVKYSTYKMEEDDE